MLKNIRRLLNETAYKRKKDRKRNLEMDVIRSSEFFDEQWYYNKYPASLYFPGGAVAHYHRYALKKQMAVGPLFDTRAYLLANPDVAGAGHNPLVHFVRHGRREGRGFDASRPLPSLRANAVENATSKITFSIFLAPGDPRHLATTLDSLSILPSEALEIIHCFDGQAARDVKNRLAGPGGGGISIVQIAPGDMAVFLRAAIAAAHNDFVILLEPGDVVTPEALYELAQFIISRTCDVVYGDERQQHDGTTELVTLLKPAWSPEMLTAFNYFGRLTAIRRSVALTALPSETAGTAAEWDWYLRVSEGTQAICHLAVTLCDRTAQSAGDARLPKGNERDHASVLREYWHRRGHEARISRASDGTFRAEWPLQKRPLVSIIIPNKNKAALLRVCTDGLFEKTAYDNIEVVIVDNGSTEPETIDLYDSLRLRSCKIIEFNEIFNYSRACNVGAANATGELLLFLNNDIEMVDPEWLDHLVRQALEPGVGIVGAQLLYPDGGIQHAGVALGLFTLAAHVFHRASKSTWGPIGTPDTSRNWMAVTGACQLMRRSVFDLVGGYDEDFLISYSDVVLCIDAVRAGFRTVYAPSAVLVHHEGASRGHTNPTNDQVLFARRLRALGIARDPYFHPRLDTLSFVPRLGAETRPETEPSPIEADVAMLAGPLARPLDLFDDGAVAAAGGVSWEAVLWTFSPAHLQPGAVGGAHILLELIRRRRDLRERFPRALSDGATGRFAAWVRSEGLALLGLGPDKTAWIDAAFASDLGAASRQHLLSNEALRTSHPLFLLPDGRAAACRVLFAAHEAGQLTQEDIWWFLIQNAESSLSALCETWAVIPSWQNEVPDGGTVFGVGKLARWVSDTLGARDSGLYAQDYPAIMSDAAQVRLAYEARSDWVERFPEAMTDAVQARALLQHLTTRASGLTFLPRRWAAERLDGPLVHEIVRPGINVLGHFAYPSGLRISTESLVEGLRENGVSTSLRDVPVSLASDDPIGHRYKGFEIYDTTLIHVQPEPLFERVYEAARLAPRQRAPYKIAYWYWEFDEVPTSWNGSALECDEIWTATNFIAEGMRKRYRQPVNVLPPGIEIAPFDRMPRSVFGLEQDTFVFLFVFHMVSIMDRKNPLALIRAFKLAFPGETKAKLVIKTSFGNRNPENLKLLHEAADDANIDVIDAVYSRDQTLSLMAASDAYVSLHRSEGLGLTMAEAMLLGRPVVATRYSGNVDFMDDGNSLLVDSRIVTLDRDIAPYKAGQRWAEPSIVHAAALMRRLYDNPDFGRSLGARAKSDLETRLNYRVTGDAVARRLAEIRCMP